MTEDWLAEAKRKKRSYSSAQPDAITCEGRGVLVSYEKDCPTCPDRRICFMEWPELDLEKVKWDKVYIYRSKKL